jgi:PilZ domain
MAVPRKSERTAGHAGEVVEVRTSKRFPVELPINIRGKSARKQQGTTFNVSAAGVYVRAEKTLKVGSRVTFDITLPRQVLGTQHAVEIRCEGRVVRADVVDGVASSKDAAPRDKLRGMACVIDQYRFIRK